MEWMIITRTGISTLLNTIYKVVMVVKDCEYANTTNSTEAFYPTVSLMLIDFFFKN